MKRQTPLLSRIGWGLTAILALMLLGSAGMKFARPPEMVEQFTGKNGFPASTLLPIGLAELVSLVLYLIPQTAVLGAILLTGYMGGAIATHVRIEENLLVPLLIGVFVWLALYLRDPRVRALLPLRQSLTDSAGSPPNS